MKETLECLAKAIRKGLYHGLGDALTTTPFETIRKIAIAKELTGIIVMSLDHFEHFVVQSAESRQRRKEHLTLNESRVQPVLIRFMHIPIIAGIETLCTAIHQSAKADGPLAVLL